MEEFKHMWILKRLHSFLTISVLLLLRTFWGFANIFSKLFGPFFLVVIQFLQLYIKKLHLEILCHLQICVNCR